MVLLGPAESLYPMDFEVEVRISEAMSIHHSAVHKLAAAQIMYIEKLVADIAMLAVCLARQALVPGS